MSIELPPLKLPALPSLPSRSFADHERYIIELREVMRCRERLLEARERILLARVAEADEQRGQWAGLCVRLEARVAELEAEAKQARMMAWAIIRAAAGESWLTVPNHVVISMNDECAIERHDDHDGYRFRAIDAARGAK